LRPIESSHVVALLSSYPFSTAGSQAHQGNSGEALWMGVFKLQIG
jgi:hypothetical protein